MKPEILSNLNFTSSKFCNDWEKCLFREQKVWYVRRISLGQFELKMEVVWVWATERVSLFSDSVVQCVMLSRSRIDNLVVANDLSLFQTDANRTMPTTTDATVIFIIDTQTDYMSSRSNATAKSIVGDEFSSYCRPAFPLFTF